MKHVVLLSGGLDSVVTMYYAAKMWPVDTIHPLFVMYGQVNRHNERGAAERAVGQCYKMFGSRVRPLKIMLLDGLIGSSMVGGEIPKDRKGLALKEIPSTYVPARNVVLLSLAYSYAEALKAHMVHIGFSGQGQESVIGWRVKNGKVTAIKPASFPDCSAEFANSFQATMRIAANGFPPMLQTPLLEKSKPEIIRLGRELGVNVSETWSCFDSGRYEENGDVLSVSPCGRCDACGIRLRAFELAKAVAVDSR